MMRCGASQGVEMSWAQIKAKLLAAAASIRKNKVLDVATEAILGEIPVVGGFLAGYWGKLGGTEDDAAQMADFIDAIASQQQAFDNLSALVAAQGEQLLEQRETLGEILLQVGRIGEIGDDVKGIKEQLGRFVRTLGVKSARDAFAAAAAMQHDIEVSGARIKAAEAALVAAGAEANAEDFFRLGILLLATGRSADAKASLLAAVDRKPDLTQALIGLGMIHQRQATEHIRQQNYGLAEDAILEAEGYVKAAMVHDPSDLGLQTQLGYLQKDMAARYGHAGQQGKAAAALAKAERFFENALKVNPADASAHNGIGSLAITRRDYDAAITATTRATELAPTYLFAWFDLAQAHHAKAQASPALEERLQHLAAFLEAYKHVVELDGKADALPPHARQAIRGMAEHVIAEAAALGGASEGS